MKNNDKEIDSFLKNFIPIIKESLLNNKNTNEKFEEQYKEIIELEKRVYEREKETNTNSDSSGIHKH